MRTCGILKEVARIIPTHITFDTIQIGNTSLICFARRKFPPTESIVAIVESIEIVENDHLWGQGDDGEL